MQGMRQTITLVLSSLLQLEKFCELGSSMMFSYKRARPKFNVLLKYEPTTNPGLVHNDDFLGRIANVEVASDRTDGNNMFKDSFEN